MWWIMAELPCCPDALELVMMNFVEFSWWGVVTRMFEVSTSVLSKRVSKCTRLELSLHRQHEILLATAGANGHAIHRHGSPRKTPLYYAHDPQGLTSSHQSASF
jgi:hypothetical protein